MRKIIHIDMDCFYASVELRERPELANQPVAVGGDPKLRGVLTTCNYIARKWGIHSAMSSAKAMKQCPHLIILPVRMALYKQVSAQIHAILRRYSDKIEPLSLDEAYLDVTNSPHCRGSATWIAEAIRRDIYNELQLTASAGVAPLKFLAKIASDKQKPNGQFVIPPEAVDDFIFALPLKAIPGVGKVTAEKLARLGLHRCGDIQQSELPFLQSHFGKFGQRLWDFSHGIDNRAVDSHRLAKSLAVENTLQEDIDSLTQAQAFMEELFQKLTERLARQGRYSLAEIKHIGVKLKFDDFQQTTLEKRQEECNEEHYQTLLSQIWTRREGRKVRLIGITAHFPEASAPAQPHAEADLPQLDLF